MPLRADQTSGRALRKVLKAHARGRVTDEGVARYLAGINLRIHSALSGADRSVGPSCIVAWRRSVGGGAHRCFVSTTPTDAEPLPSIVTGFHLNDIFGVLFPRLMDRFKRRKDGELAPRDEDEEARAIDTCSDCPTSVNRSLTM